MSDQPLQWQVQPPVQPPEWFIQAVKTHAPTVDGRYAAQLLWQRGIQDVEQLAGYLNPKSYQPASPLEFGQEMGWAVERLQRARVFGEIVTIWGDFDADGITATSVLWEGLGQFFLQNQRLFYYIPNRLTESHGLNLQGIDRIAQTGTQLIVTCDTGSTNLTEIEYARQLGIDVIVTDHHTLPPERPPVTAIINPRYLPTHHPLFHLSGVAVAYKLVEALYEKLPEIPQQPLEDLLDLVAIGLIADLVQLSGDCRYLAQQGIQRLQEQTKKPTRPGVARLLELCQRSGDRPTDISFGIGPRINAVSRIHGDASFCVELLTSRDKTRCHELASETELANTRRKSLQKDVTHTVKEKLSQLDLSTTSVIVLVDSGLPLGVLGLVAGQVAQEYGRPTILLTTENLEDNSESSKIALAKGSARSVNNIDLYQLVQSQAHLLHRFGGHPFAAGLSLAVENIPVFTQAINQQLRQLSLASGALMMPIIQADVVVTVADLGKDLFRELKLLEPCGMGNPVPKLLIKNCSFEKVFNRNIKDYKGNKIQYIKTEFQIVDRSSSRRFPGIWWGHYKDEVPTEKCDAIVELDYNAYQARYEVRLIAVRPSTENSQLPTPQSLPHIEIVDWRSRQTAQQLSLLESILPIDECPRSWDNLQVWFRQAIQTHQKLAIAYPPPNLVAPQKIWEQLVGIAKYLSRTGKTATLAQLKEKLKLSDRTLERGLQTLSIVGFEVSVANSTVEIAWHEDAYPLSVNTEVSAAIEQFLAALKEEQFYLQYFYVVPLSTMETVARQTLGGIR